MTAERRKNTRLGLAIPLRIQGYLSDGSTWEEFSTTDDVSLGGSCFALSHDVELGQILFLTLPLPKRLRQFDLTDATYRIYTLVRSVRRRPDQPRVGVMYFGKYPPRDFHERPGARYLLPSDNQPDTPPPAPPRPPAGPSPEPPPEDDDADTLPPAGAPEPPSPGPDSHPEPVSAGQPEASSPRSEAEKDPEPGPRPLDGAIPEAPAPAPDSEAPPAARAANWGTETSQEARPGVPPAPTPSAPVVEFHPSRGVPRERRIFPRVELFVNFVIQQVDEWGAVLQEELTVADNVGRGGARVMTTLDFAEGSVVLLQEAGGGFATRAEVRGITRVHPSAGRLHLRFLDREAPERLLRQ